MITNIGGNGGYFTSSGAWGFSLGNQRPKATFDEWTAGSIVKTWGHNLTLEAEATDDLRLRSITAYRDLRTLYQANNDGGNPAPTDPYRQQPDNPYRRTFKKFTYDPTVTYHVTPDLNVYGRYATAYLAGGQIRNVPFDLETTKAVELGRLRSGVPRDDAL